MERKPYRLFARREGYISHRFTGSFRYRQNKWKPLVCLSAQTKPYGISFKYWEMLHFGRFGEYGFKMGKPKTLELHRNRRFQKSRRIYEKARKKRLKTRSYFDWLVALQAVKSGWSRERYFALYENYASDLNVAWNFVKVGGLSYAYLSKKYDCALRKVKSAHDSRRSILAKFLRLVLEKRKQVKLNNGQLAVILGLLYARQRTAGDEITLSMRELSLISGVDLSTVSRAIKTMEGTWLSITHPADLRRGNTYKIHEIPILRLYENSFGISEPVRELKTANCIAPLDHALFMRKGLGILGHLLILKLGLETAGFTRNHLRKALNIESRSFNILIGKLINIGAVRINGQGMICSHDFHFDQAAKTLGVNNSKIQLNEKYIYEHKLHRLRVLAYQLRKLDLKLYQQPGKTRLQKELQERFRRIWLKKPCHPLHVLGSHVLRMRLNSTPEYGIWLKSASARPLKNMIAYLLKTGCYILYDEYSKPDIIFDQNLMLLAHQQIGKAITFIIPEELAHE